MSDEPRNLNDFEIVREIGRGGTAIVYEAHQKSLRRKVALKQLPAAAALDQRWLGRFHREVRAASQLNHANIVRFYELGQENGSHYYTMQLVDGISLAEVVRRLRQCRASVDGGSRPCMNVEADAVHPAFLKLCQRCKCRFACHNAKTSLDVVDLAEPRSERVDIVASPLYHRAVAELARDAALAVDYAHNQGILHLDLKPSNLLIDGQGKLWVTDFGASRSSSGSGSSGAVGLSGTMSYMSPEQALGRDERLDRRSDVFSLGTTLYELLTLERPIADDSPQALMAQVALERSKTPRRVNKAIPRDLVAIIRKAMAGQPQHRYATACDLSEDLEKYLTSSTNRTGTQNPRFPRRVRILAGIFAVVTFVCLAVLAVTPWRDSFPGPVYQWNGHFYALTDEKTDWISAESEAVAYGGHLITINDHREQEFVAATFLSPPDKAYWIGLTDRRQEGVWHWVSGDSVRYTNWEPGEPNNVQHSSAGEDYAVLNHHMLHPKAFLRQKGTWNDLAPDYKRFHGIMEFASDPR